MAAAGDEEVDGVSILSSLSSSGKGKRKRNGGEKMNLGEKRGGADDGSGEAKESEKERRASSAAFPMSRVRRLVRGEASAAGISDTRSTHDAVFLINKASEMFLHLFSQDAFARASGNRNSITYHHLSSTVSNTKRYEFLSDFVPEKVKAEDALKARALVET